MGKFCDIRELKSILYFVSFEIAVMPFDEMLISDVCSMGSSLPKALFSQAGISAKIVEVLLLNVTLSGIKGIFVSSLSSETKRMIFSRKFSKGSGIGMNINRSPKTAHKEMKRAHPFMGKAFLCFAQRGASSEKQSFISTAVIVFTKGAEGSF